MEESFLIRALALEGQICLFSAPMSFPTNLLSQVHGPPLETARRVLYKPRLAMRAFRALGPGNPKGIRGALSQLQMPSLP
jgi:hypothetical protein